jgi:hypothetical protein
MTIALRRYFPIGVLFAVVGASGAWVGAAGAQNTPGTHQDNGGINGSLSREDLEKLGGDHKNDGSADMPKDPILARAKAKAQSVPLLQTLQISCDINDAKLVVVGKRRPASGGKEVETRVYEVACKGSLGYLLETQGADKPIAISCLNAEEVRAADAAKGKEPTFFCNLPGNKDVYAWVASMITAATGARCEISTLQFFGRSESTHSDYSEAACQDGNGFLLRVAQPGSQANSVVMSCLEAAKQSIKCKLTDPGPVEAPVTLQTFKDALGRNGVTCTVGQIRLIGQEENLKRYVVEYLCAEQANGVVAFIPLQGNSNPFDSLDCATALSSRGVTCALAPQK